MNYELLTGTVDPCIVQTQLFCCDLLTIEDLVDIHEVYEESGRKCACEKMIALLFRTWRDDSLDQFIQVLDDCGYKECANQFYGEYSAESKIFTPCTRIHSRGIVFCCQFVCLSALFWAVCMFEERSRARLNPDR